MIKQRRKFTPSRNRIRNLSQYKDMSDDEFDDIYSEMFDADTEGDIPDTSLNDEMKKRAKERMDRLGEDYDLTDMKANDMMQLESLVIAMILLEDLEKDFYRLKENVSDSAIYAMDKVNKIMSDLRTDISKISTDLQLTKKIRNQSNETSIREKWEELTQKALVFYKQKMLYIFCTKCRHLLSTVWLLYPDTNNKIYLHCERCGNTLEQSLAELYEAGNKNLDDVRLP